jgi:hypothetical protein
MFVENILLIVLSCGDIAYRQAGATATLTPQLTEG